MSRFVPHRRHADQEVGELRAQSGPNRYVTVPGCVGSAGEAAVSATIPTWAIITAGLAGAWYLGVPLPVIGKRKK